MKTGVQRAGVETTRERESSDGLDKLGKEGDRMGDEVRLPERDGRRNDRTREREERD